MILADSISLSGVSTDLGTRTLCEGSITNGPVGASGLTDCSTQLNAHLEGCLATEASMIVLDTLELIVQVWWLNNTFSNFQNKDYFVSVEFILCFWYTQVVSHTDHSQGLLTSVLKVLLHALGTNQSTFFIRHLFAVQRSFVFKVLCKNYVT